MDAGRDLLTGRKRQKTGTAATKAEARQLEARLISQVGAGQHGGAAGKTVAGATAVSVALNIAHAPEHVSAQLFAALCPRWCCWGCWSC